MCLMKRLINLRKITSLCEMEHQFFYSCSLNKLLLLCSTVFQLVIPEVNLVLSMELGGSVVL